jgi:hypothetical protein
MEELLQYSQRLVTLLSMLRIARRGKTKLMFDLLPSFCHTGAAPIKHCKQEWQAPSLRFVLKQQ